MFLLLALLISSPFAHGWCVNSPQQLPNCADLTSSSTVGCYAYSQCAVSMGDTFTGTISTTQDDSFSAFLMSASDFAAYQAGNPFSCYSGFGSCENGTPSPGTSSKSISGSWTAASTNYLVIECDNLALSCQLEYNFNLKASGGSTPTSPATSAPVVLPTSPPAPAPGAVSWGGRYEVQAGCDQSTCCCLTGTVFVTQNGVTLGFSGGLAGQCGGTSTFSGASTLTALSSNVASFSVLGDNFTATRSGNIVSVVNQQSPKCSGTATCTAGACLSTTLTSSSSSSSSSSSATSSEAIHVTLTLPFIMLSLVLCYLV